MLDLPSHSELFKCTSWMLITRIGLIAVYIYYIKSPIMRVRIVLNKPLSIVAMYAVQQTQVHRETPSKHCIPKQHAAVLSMLVTTV